MPWETAPHTPLIVRSFQQPSVACREFREAIPGEELLQRSSRRRGENGTHGVKDYVKCVGCIFQTTKSSREILTEPSSMAPPFGGVGFSSERPLPTTYISKNHRAVSTRGPSGENFAATTNLRLENQSPNLHKRRIVTSAP